IDVEALGHVVNFDIPMTPDDYIHRIGRTGRAELTGDAFTFVAPEEESGLQAIEQVLGKRLPRVMVPDFDYHAKPEGRVELPRGARSGGSPRAHGGVSPRSQGGGGRGAARRGAQGRRPGSRRSGSRRNR